MPRKRVPAMRLVDANENNRQFHKKDAEIGNEANRVLAFTRMVIRTTDELISNHVPLPNPD